MRESIRFWALLTESEDPHGEQGKFFLWMQLNRDIQNENVFKLDSKTNVICKGDKVLALEIIASAA